MRTFFLVFFAAITSVLSAEDDVRTGTPKSCYLYSWGKGPDWAAKVSMEFRLGLLDRQMPYVDDKYFEPTEKALTWIDRQKAPKITTLATVERRKVIQIDYPDENGSFGRTIDTILLAIETAPDSGWFSPFFAAEPELFSGQLVSGKDVALGYVATLGSSGTGAFRTHHLFDLCKPHPVIIATLAAGRVARNDYASDAEYEQALKIFDLEADLLAGTIPKTTNTKK